MDGEDVVIERHGAEVRCRQECLPPPPDGTHQPCAPLLIELAQNIVEQQYRDLVSKLGKRISLRKNERQQRDSLLALRSETTEVTAVRAEPEVVAVRPVR